MALAAEADHPRFWRWYAAWVLARISGRVPLGAVSDAVSPEALAAGPSCGQRQAGLRHFACRCPATAGLWADLVPAVGYRGVREDWGSVSTMLFGQAAAPASRAHHVRFIGLIADGLAGRSFPRATVQAQHTP